MVGQLHKSWITRNKKRSNAFPLSLLDRRNLTQKEKIYEEIHVYPTISFVPLATHAITSLLKISMGDEVLMAISSQLVRSLTTYGAFCRKICIS